MKLVFKAIKIMGLSVIGASVLTVGIVALDSMTQTYAAERDDIPFEFSSYVEEGIYEDYDFYSLNITEAVQEEYEEEDRELSIIDIMADAKEIDLNAVVAAVEEEKAPQATVIEIITEVITEEVAQIKETTSLSLPIPNVVLTDEQCKPLAISNAEAYREYSSKVIELINDYRRENGKPALYEDNSLALVASHRSTENAWVDCFDVKVVDGKSHHIRPNGMKASSVFTVYGLYGSYAENMGRYQRNPEEIVLGWKNSMAHNELMLKESYTKIGVGVAANANGDLYWTAVFSR